MRTTGIFNTLLDSRKRKKSWTILMLFSCWETALQATKSSSKFKKIKTKPKQCIFQYFNYIKIIFFHCLKWWNEKWESIKPLQSQMFEICRCGGIKIWMYYVAHYRQQRAWGERQIQRTNTRGLEMCIQSVNLHTIIILNSTFICWHWDSISICKSFYLVLMSFFSDHWLEWNV